MKTGNQFTPIWGFEKVYYNRARYPLAKLRENVSAPAEQERRSEC